MKFKIIEAFRSFQGEGPDQGNIMFFIRFKKCKMPGLTERCKWCDTTCKMDFNAEVEISMDEINKNLEMCNGNLCITGGEPTLYNDKIIEILKNSKNINNINIESNGLALPELINSISDLENNIIDKCKFIYSPKMFNSTDWRSNIKIMEKLIETDGDVYLKIVVDEELNETYFEYFISKFPNNRIWAMPKGVTIDEMKKNSSIVYKFANKYQINISTRMHIIHNFA